MGPMPYWTAVEYDQGEQPWHQLLTCFRYKSADERKAVRTTNAIERPFREVRRRTRPMGTFQDITSMDRILFAVFIHENKSQGVGTLLLLTQNN
jgi:transposase-like protein